MSSGGTEFIQHGAYQYESSYILNRVYTHMEYYIATEKNRAPLHMYRHRKHASICCYGNKARCEAVCVLGSCCIKSHRSTSSCDLGSGSKPRLTGCRAQTTWMKAWFTTNYLCYLEQWLELSMPQFPHL